jgi:hypothetical protein
LLAEELAAGRDVCDATGVERRIAQRESLVELLLPLEEELPLLGQRQLEACQVDLLLIGLDGREVGEERAVDSRRWRQRVARIESRLSGRRDLILRPRQRVRHDLESIERRRHIQAGEAAGPRPATDCRAARSRNSSRGYDGDSGRS